MTSPIPAWDLVRVYGSWASFDALRPGTYTITIPARVTDASDDKIIPAGVFKSGSLQTAVGTSPSLDVMVPATDDPDIEQTGWKIQIAVKFSDGSAAENYSIDVPYANRPSGSGGNGEGVNLRTVALAQQLPQTTALYKVGVPGGLAKLNSDGEVIDADGDVVGGIASVASTDITDASAIGKSVLTAANAAAVRAAIGAGTSSLALGATGSTALAGNTAFVPPTRTVAGKALSGDVTISASDVGAVPTARTVNGKALSSNVVLSNSDVNAPTVCAEVSGTYPGRPASTLPVFFIGPDTPAGGGTTAGGAGAVNNLDFYIKTAT